MTSEWQDLPECDGGMSNVDFSIDDGVEEALRSGQHCHYAGWNFAGYVWFADDKFKCEVWQYKSPQEVIEAEDLEALMHAVSAEYGYA